MRRSFTQYVEKTFSKQIIEEIRNLVEKTNISGLETSVTGMSVWQIDLNCLYRYDDYAELPIIVSATISSEEDGRTFSRRAYMRGMISGTFSDHLDDFQIELKDFLKSSPKKSPMKVWDDLLMKTNTQEFEQEVYKMLFKAYKYLHVEKHPERINTSFVAAALGYSVVFANLGPEEEVRGAFTLVDTKIQIYDNQIGDYRIVRAKARKIIINMALKGNWVAVRFTVMHELIHAYVQRFAMWFNQMCDRTYGEFRCPTRSSDEYQFMDDFLERAERQADYGASLGLMPREAFRIKAEELLKSYGALPDPETIKEVVEKTAAFFEVSISAAKRSMTDIDFEEAKGVFNFVDGKYVPPFGYRRGFLEKGETLVISESQLRTILARDKKMAKHVSHGRVCFVENHLVINTPDFIEGSGKNAQLTDHARKHMDECAFKFKLIFQNDEVAYHRYTSNGEVAYRSVTTLLPILVIISDTNTTMEQKADQLKERTDDITAISKKIGNDFPSSLDAVMQWSEIEPKKIAEEAWVNPKTLYTLRTDDTVRPTLQLMIRLCIAMKLPSEVSYRLIEASGCGKRANVEEIGCAQFLEAPGAFTVETAHELLILQGKKGLGRKNPVV